MFHSPPGALLVVAVVLHLDAKELPWDFECSSLPASCGLNDEIFGPSGCRLTLFARRLGISRSSTPSSDGPDVFVSEGVHVLLFLFFPSVVVGKLLNVLQG